MQCIIAVVCFLSLQITEIQIYIHRQNRDGGQNKNIKTVFPHWLAVKKQPLTMHCDGFPVLLNSVPGYHLHGDDIYSLPGESESHAPLQCDYWLGLFNQRWERNTYLGTQEWKTKNKKTYRVRIACQFRLVAKRKHSLFFLNHICSAYAVYIISVVLIWQI